MEEGIDTNLIAAFKTIEQPTTSDDTLRADLEALARLLQEAPPDLKAPALVFRSREGTVVVTPIGNELMCGRAVDCTLRFPDLREISRHHFTIKKENDIYWLVDHGSFNGTKVRGRPIKKHELRDGDLINAAGVLFAFIRE